MSLRERLEKRAWENDWPSLPSDAVLPPAHWLEALPLNLFEDVSARYRPLAEQSFAQFPSIVNGQSHAPLPQAVLERYLDALDTWNHAVRWQATWPPSLEGLGSAIAASAKPDFKHASTEVTLGLALLLHAYPKLAWASIQSLPTWKRKTLPEAWFQEIEPTLAPSAPSEDETSAPTPSPAPVAAPVAEPAPQPSQRAEPPPSALWLQGVLQDLKDAQAPQPLLRQRLDAEIKQHRQAHPRADWFEAEFFPALLHQPMDLLRVMLRNWPDDLSFTVDDPVAWVKTRGFWQQLQAAEDTQALMMRQVLPRLVDTRHWSDMTRVVLLRFMVNYTKHDPQAFEQRMDLWQAWGGRLDQNGRLPKDPVPETSGFSAQQPTTVLDWIREAQVPAWNAWCQRQSALMDESGMSSPPTPARPRRSGP